MKLFGLFLSFSAVVDRITIILHYRVFNTTYPRKQNALGARSDKVCRRPTRVLCPVLPWKRRRRRREYKSNATRISRKNPDNVHHSILSRRHRAVVRAVHVREVITVISFSSVGKQTISPKIHIRRGVARRVFRSHRCDSYLY